MSYMSWNTCRERKRSTPEHLYEISVLTQKNAHLVSGCVRGVHNKEVEKKRSRPFGRPAIPAF